MHTGWQARTRSARARAPARRPRLLRPRHSFQTANGSGDYIRHSGFQLHLQANDGSTLFANDATFCPRAGNSGSNFSLMSYNFSYKYVRHFNFLGYIASDGGSNAWDASSLWNQDTTWASASPWA